MKNKRCPACRSRQVASVEQVSMARVRSVWARHYPRTARLPLGAKDERIRMFGCKECLLEWAAPRIVAESAWYARVPAYPAERWEYDLALLSIDARSRVLELGCGPGHFLRRAREYGVEATGFDINDGAVRLARASGLAAFQGDLAEALAANVARGGTPVIVAAFHLIEHVKHLHHFGSRLSRLATEVHLSFPNPERWTRHLLPGWRAGEHEMWNYPPWHQSRWGRESIVAFAARFGFKLVSYMEEPLCLYEAVSAAAYETGLEPREVEEKLLALAARGVQVGGRSSYVHLRAGRARPRGVRL